MCDIHPPRPFVLIAVVWCAVVCLPAGSTRAPPEGVRGQGGRAPTNSPVHLFRRTWAVRSGIASSQQPTPSVKTGPIMGLIQMSIEFCVGSSLQARVGGRAAFGGEVFSFSAINALHFFSYFFGGEQRATLSVSRWNWVLSSNNGFCQLGSAIVYTLCWKQQRELACLPTALLSC